MVRSSRSVMGGGEGAAALEYLLPSSPFIQLTRAQMLPVRVAVAGMCLRAELAGRHQAYRQDERPNVAPHPCPWTPRAPPAARAHHGP